MNSFLSLVSNYLRSTDQNREWRSSSCTVLVIHQQSPNSSVNRNDETKLSEVAHPCLLFSFVFLRHQCCSKWRSTFRDQIMGRQCSMKLLEAGKIVCSEVSRHSITTYSVYTSVSCYSDMGHYGGWKVKPTKHLIRKDQHTFQRLYVYLCV